MTDTDIEKEREKNALTIFFPSQMRKFFASLPARQNKLLFPGQEDQQEEDEDLDQEQEEEDEDEDKDQGHQEEKEEDEDQEDEDDLGMVEAEVAFSRQFNQDEL